MSNLERLVFMVLRRQCIARKAMALKIVRMAGA